MTGSLFFQMLVVFKSAPILKRALKVKQAMMQLYVLKLLKMQASSPLLHLSSPKGGIMLKYEYAFQ